MGVGITLLPLNQELLDNELLAWILAHGYEWVSGKDKQVHHHLLLNHGYLEHSISIDTGWANFKLRKGVASHRLKQLKENDNGI